MSISESIATFDPPFLASGEVVLRPLFEADADGPYPSWLNDAEVCRYNRHHAYPYTREMAREWIRGIPGRGDLVLAVTLADNGVHVGNVSLQQFDAQARSAEFAILIGDRGAWGRGLGRTSAELLVAHGFDTLNLHRISCGTTEDNAAMRSIAEGLGMTREGVRREAAFHEGHYVDVVEYGLLAHEFRNTRA